MMSKAAFGLVASFIGVSLSFISLVFYLALFHRGSSYFREIFLKKIRWRYGRKAFRDIHFALSPCIFFAFSFISAGLAVALELFVALLLSISLTSMDILADPAGIILLMSAGPIEEGTKLSMAIIGVLFIYLLIGGRGGSGPARRLTIRDGIIIGLFTGASFGLLEAMLYMVTDISLMFKSGMGFEVLFSLGWRFTLGIFVHAIYTGIASSFLGDRLWVRKVLGTIGVYLLAATLHALNNGIPGVIIYRMDDTSVGALMLVLALQLFLIAISCVALFLLWRRDEKQDYRSKRSIV